MFLNFTSHRERDQEFTNSFGRLPSFTLRTGIWAKQMKWVKELASNSNVKFFAFQRKHTLEWNHEIQLFSIRWRILFVSKACNQFINVDQMQKRAHNTLLFGIRFPLVSKPKSCAIELLYETQSILNLYSGNK